MNYIICVIFLILFYPSNPLINCQAKPSQIKPGFYRKSYQEEPTVTSRAVRTCSISEELKEKLRSEHDVVKMLKWSKIGSQLCSIFRDLQSMFWSGHYWGRWRLSVGCWAPEILATYAHRRGMKKMWSNATKKTRGRQGKGNASIVGYCWDRASQRSSPVWQNLDLSNMLLCCQTYPQCPQGKTKTNWSQWRTAMIKLP